MAEALAAAEMVLAREQKLSALDGLAAAAAHGLGTPLATIAVVTKELMRDAKPSDPHYEDVVLLRAQAERCRHILAELAARGEQIDIIVSRLPVSHLIEEVVAPHRLVAVPIEVRTGPAAERSAGEPERGRADHRAESWRPLRARQSAGERRRLCRHQGRGRRALVKGRGQDRDRRRRLGLSRLTCWSSSASRSSPRARPRASVRRRPTSISAWGSASSSPRRCSNGPARRSRSPIAPNPRPERWSPSRGRDREIRANVRRSPVQTRTCGTLAWARARFSARSARLRASR